jgi:hypothetical protein
MENVPLRIRVHPAVTPAPSPGDRIRGFLELLKSYWIQITAAAGGLAAAARFGWRWYRRRNDRDHQPGAPAEPGPDSDNGGPAEGSDTCVRSPGGQEENPASTTPLSES